MIYIFNIALLILLLWANYKTGKYMNKMHKFIRTVAHDYDCDSGANGTHPHYCRACAAKKLLEEI